MKQKPFGVKSLFFVAAAMLLLNRPHVAAHCDALDGPVVKAAQEALSSGNLNSVLPWVQKGDEREIEHAFHRTLTVRKLGPEARELADRFFFETVVRVHRAGESAPFTGLKPPGTGVTPAIAGADKALETGDVMPLVKELNQQVSDGIRARFKNAALRKNFELADVTAGRAYVQAYVEYIHYVERIHVATVKSWENHSKTGAAPHAEPENYATPLKGAHQH
jgi:hypothetical protein